GYANSQLLRRVKVANNLLTNVGLKSLGGLGRMFQINGRTHDLIIEQNTGFSTIGYVQFGDSKPVIKERFVFRNNIGGNASYNLQAPAGNGALALTRYLGPGFIFAGNVIVGSSQGMPNGNSYPATVDQVGFTNLAGGDLSLSSSSPYLKSGIGGTTPGADL